MHEHADSPRTIRVATLYPVPCRDGRTCLRGSWGAVDIRVVENNDRASFTLYIAPRSDETRKEQL